MSTSSSTANTSCNRMINFSDDLLGLIFMYASGTDLLQIDRVNTNWHQILRQKDALLWKVLTEQVWAQSSFHHIEEVNLLRRIEQLSLLLLKKALVGIDLSRCVEKKDYQRMLLARLVFYPVMLEELKRSDSRFAGRYLSMYYPDWSLAIPPYKASYFHAKQELRRKDITIYELCHIEWTFKFKHQFNYPIDPDEDNHEGGNHITGWRCEFREDYTMISTLQGQEYDWRFVEGMDGITRIQVASYPALSSYRLSDGSWGLENSHVYFRQRNNLDLDLMPVTATIGSK